MFFNLESRSSEQISLETFHSQLEASVQSGFYWIDIENRDVSALEETLNLLSVNFVWENYFGRSEVLPHLKDSPSSISFYLYDIINADSHSNAANDITEIKHEPFLLILSEKFVISYHQKPLDVIQHVKKDCAENFELAGKSPAFMAFLLIQHNLFNYARINLANDNFLDSIESNVLTKKNIDYLPKISIAGYNILMLKKMNANLHIILLVLVTKRSYVVIEDARLAFNQMLIDSIGIRETIDSSRDLLDSIIGSIQAEASGKTNEIVQILTMLSAVFLPLTLVSGIYGMNFVYFPELHWKYGYFYAISMMLIITTCFLYFFKRKGWLWSKTKIGKE